MMAAPGEEEQDVREIAPELINLLVALDGVQPMVAMLKMVATKMEVDKSERDAWVKAVHAKLVDVGIETIQDVVCHTVVISGATSYNAQLDLCRSCRHDVWPQRGIGTENRIYT
jgi:hypothetical protein